MPRSNAPSFTYAQIVVLREVAQRVKDETSTDTSGHTVGLVVDLRWPIPEGFADLVSLEYLKLKTYRGCVIAILTTTGRAWLETPFP